MPEVTYTTELSQPKKIVWDFVSDMNNWAPFLTGYQAHEQLNATDSIWTLKGDVGVLARTVRLRAHVTEWNESDRVAFTLTGLNEPVEGGGLLVLSSVAPRATGARETPLARRLFQALFRWLYRLRYGAPPALRARSAAAESAHLTFTLRMDAGGPTGPLVNAMLGPVMLPAAEALAKSIAAHLEKTHG